MIYLSDAWTGTQWMTTTDHFLILLRTHVKLNVPFDFFIAKSTCLARVLFITLCLHTVSWDLRRDRASNHFRSIEIGENASCDARVVFYVVIVVRWYTGSWIIWSVSRSMGRMIIWSVSRSMAHMAFFFQSPDCVWVSSIDWCVVSVGGARSGEQSPQSARWIGVLVVVARSDEAPDYAWGSAVLDFGKGREAHHRMLGEACGVMAMGSISIESFSIE